MSKAETSRRDFIFVTTAAVAAGGVGLAAIPLVGQWSPAADTAAKAGIDIDLSKLAEGEEMRLLILGRPVAIRHRRPDEIAAAKADDEAEMIHPETDRSRLKSKPDGSIDPRYLVFVPVCTHFGCHVVGEAGRFDGWYCPCHGAHFDTSGRVRTPPAPKNMTIPHYRWISDTVITLYGAEF